MNINIKIDGAHGEGKTQVLQIIEKALRDNFTVESLNRNERFRLSKLPTEHLAATLKLK